MSVPTEKTKAPKPAKEAMAPEERAKQLRQKILDANGRIETLENSSKKAAMKVGLDKLKAELAMLEAPASAEKPAEAPPEKPVEAPPEKPVEKPVKDSDRVTWREMELRGLIRCCCVVGVPFHLLFGFPSDGNMTHIDRLSKLSYALTRNDKPLSEEARKRLTMEKELVGALLRGDGDAEIAYGAFQVAVAEKAKADAEKAKAEAEKPKADAEKPKADDKGATYDSDDEGPASEAALTAEQQREAKEEDYVAMRVGLAEMYDKDKITKLFDRFGLSYTKFFHFTEKEEPSTEELARRLRVILERFAKEDRDLQELAICIADIAGRKCMCAFFLCEMFQETVDVALKHNPTFRRTLCSLLRIENKTLPEVLGAYVDTLRDSTDPNIMERVIEVTEDPALNLLPYFCVFEDIDELISEDDYETKEGYDEAYKRKVGLEWFLFLYEYKSIEQVSVSHSSNSSCSSEIMLVSDIFQTNKTLHKSNVSWMTAMSWLKKLWYQACEKQGNKIKTAGTHYAIFGLPFEPYALSEDSLKTVTDIYRTLSLRSETYLKDEYKKKLEEYEEMKKVNPSSSDPPPPLDLYTRLSLIGDYRHPDKGGKREMFNILSNAYKTLTDLPKKLAYDDATFEADDTDYMRISVYSMISDLLDEDDEESDCEKLEETKSDEEDSDEEDSDEETSDE